MLLHLTEKSEEPLHSQISRQLTNKIIEGDLLDGAELDSIRTFAASQRVSVNTVKRAYEELERDGLIISPTGKGFSVAALTPEQKQTIAMQRLLGSHSMLNVGESFSKQLISVFDPELLRNLVEENLKIEKELAMAQQIQADLLPKELPDNDLFSLAAYSSPSKVVGGDFYDYIPIDENRFGLVIADACGKGLPAAMLISQIQAMVKSEINNGNDIQATLEHLNQQVVCYTPKDRFVTLFYGVYNERTSEFEYATAGHDYPILIRKNSACENLQSGGPALGLLEQAVYETSSVKLNSGDTIVFFTDGLTETMNVEKEIYGIERLSKLLSENHSHKADQLIKTVLDGIDKFSGNETVLDDRTVLVLKVGCGEKINRRAREGVAENRRENIKGEKLCMRMKYQVK